MTNWLGRRFGRLTVEQELASIKKQKYRTGKIVVCLCDCGNSVTLDSRALKSGNTKSCGCLKKETASRMNYKHGNASKDKHPLYRVWRGIKVRCFNPRCAAFKHYGGRGITIAEVWKNDPAAFVEWCLANGWAPHLTIERNDNDGHYEPSNISFISKGENTKRRLAWRKRQKLSDHINSALGLPA
jgi:hypothetical protein